MKLNKTETVGEHKILHIREITDSGGYHRRVLTCDMDVSSEVQEIKDKAEALWTDKLILTGTDKLDAYNSAGNVDIYCSYIDQDWT